MYWKKFCIPLILLLINFNSCNSEQVAAENYREMFRDGNFYVEFKDKWGTRILAGKNNVRMERMRYEFESGSIAYLNPLGMLFGGESKNPEVMYKDGKFYNFVEKDKANVCDEKNLRDENIDPRQGWNKISQKLALPDELAIFFWNDSFRWHTPSIAAPTLLQSIKKNSDGKEYDCDRYTCDIKTAAGNDVAWLIYDALYKDGRLVRVESYVFRNGRSYPLNVLEIKKIQVEIPKGTFKIYKNTKLYSAGIGDINDLLEKPVQIGIMEEESL